MNMNGESFSAHLTIGGILCHKSHLHALMQYHRGVKKVYGEKKIVFMNIIDDSK